MPSSATITAFYSFQANTKARASYVNTNFSNFRGHIIAIDPNTATSATTETYDLGSTEYRWRTGYFREVDFKSNTTTGQALQIVGDTAAGNGAFNFHIGSTIAGQINTSGFVGDVSGRLIKLLSMTTSASYGQIAKSALTDGTYIMTASAFAIPGSTITLQTIGRPVQLIVSSLNTITSAFNVGASTITSSDIWSLQLRFKRDGTTIKRVFFGSTGWTSGSTGITMSFDYGDIIYTDYSSTSGTHTYHLEAQPAGNQALNISSMIFIAKEV